MQMVGFRLNLTDIMLGILLGTAFIITILMTPFMLGLPNVPFALSDKLIVQGIVAPIIEESAFRVALPLLIPGVFLGGLISTLAFALYHYGVYGGFANLTLLLSAGVFGLVAYVISRYRDNIVSAIIMHAMINVILIIKTII